MKCPVKGCEEELDNGTIEPSGWWGRQFNPVRPTCMSYSHKRKEADGDPVLIETENGRHHGYSKLIETIPTKEGYEILTKHL